MTNEEKAKEIVQKIKFSTNLHPVLNEKMYDAAMKMAEWKESQLLEVCKNCEQKSIINGHLGCAFRSLEKTYCWRD